MEAEKRLSEQAWKEGAAILAGSLALAVATWVDLHIGGDAAPALLYLLPVVAVAAYSRITRTMLASALALALWTWVHLSQNRAESWPVAAWNGFTRLVIFGGGGLLVWFYFELKRRNGQLHEVMAAEKRLARQDPLTGLPNSRSFLEDLGQALDRSKAERRSICVAMLDLDHFKQVNDRFGHAAGNAALVSVALGLGRVCGEMNVAARVGGDEFAILFSCDLERAAMLGEACVREIREIALAYPGSGLGASIGIVRSSSPTQDVDGLLKAADILMYEAKTGGRSRCLVRDLDGGPDPVLS